MYVTQIAPERLSSRPCPSATPNADEPIFVAQKSFVDRPEGPLARCCTPTSGLAFAPLLATCLVKFFTEERGRSCPQAQLPPHAQLPSTAFERIPTMPRKIILDCDPGHDDAIAMLLAHGSPDIELLGISTVNGNQTLDKVTNNARRLATQFNIRGVPIVRGASRPLVREAVVAPEQHGESGLDGVVLPEPADLDPRHAVQFIIDTLMAYQPGEVTLVPTGPLTNIALAARLEPRIVERVREVVLMGGSCHGGNWSAAAEFNIMADPEAAHIVFGEKWPVVMVGLDLTHQALATDAVIDQLTDIGGPTAQFVLDLFTFFRQAYKDSQGFDHPPVHDPCTVAYLIDPSVVKTVKAPIQIELSGALTTGMTVVDVRTPPGPDCHTWAATELDFGRFWHLIFQAVRNVNRSLAAQRA